MGDPEIRARGDKAADIEEMKPELYCDSDVYRMKPRPDTRKKAIAAKIWAPLSMASLKLCGPETVSITHKNELARAAANQDRSAAGYRKEHVGSDRPCTRRSVQRQFPG